MVKMVWRMYVCYSRGTPFSEGRAPDLHEWSLKNWNQPRCCHQLNGARGHIHAMQASGGLELQSPGGQVCQGQLSLPSFQGRYVSKRKILRQDRGNSRALPRALNSGAIAV